MFRVTVTLASAKERASCILQRLEMLDAKVFVDRVIISTHNGTECARRNSTDRGRKASESMPVDDGGRYDCATTTLPDRHPDSGVGDSKYGSAFMEIVRSRKQCMPIPILYATGISKPRLYTPTAARNRCSFLMKKIEFNPTNQDDCHT